MATISSATILPLIAVDVVLERYIVKGLTAGAVNRGVAGCGESAQVIIRQDGEKKIARRITIRDVAQRADVGVGTVSRVLNDHPLVSDEVRARVQAIIEELKFQPNSLAQNMRRARSKTIGVVVPSLVNPFFAELVQAIEEVAREHTHHIYLMSSLEDPETEQACIDSLESRRVDGIALVPTDLGRESRSRRGVRIIHVDRIGRSQPGLGADHFAGAVMAAELLISLGHSRIGIIAGPRTAVAAEARLAGFMSVMTPVYERLGLPADELVHFGPFDMATGMAGAMRLLDRAEPPTAIFACSDIQAIGAMRAAFDLRLSVPADLSIMGFDGIPVTDMVSPRLTTIAQPVREIAQAIIEALTSDTNTKAEQLFACSIKTGESVARVPCARIGGYAAKPDI